MHRSIIADCVPDLVRFGHAGHDGRRMALLPDVPASTLSSHFKSYGNFAIANAVALICGPAARRHQRKGKMRRAPSAR